MLKQIIESHKSWVVQFKLLTGDQNTVGTVDQRRIDDAHECDLGHAFDSGLISFESPMLLGIAQDLHNAFHGIASLIVKLHDEGKDQAVIGPYLSDLEHLSEQLVRVLNQAQDKTVA